MRNRPLSVYYTVFADKMEAPAPVSLLVFLPGGEYNEDHGSFLPFFQRDECICWEIFTFT